MNYWFDIPLIKRPNPLILLHAIFRRTGSLIDLFSNFPSTHSTHKLQMSSTNTHHPVVLPATQQSLAPGACNLCKRSVRGLVLRIGRTEPSRTSWVLTSLADSKRLGSPFVSQRQWKPVWPTMPEPILLSISWGTMKGPGVFLLSQDRVVLFTEKSSIRLTQNNREKRQ